MNKFMEKHGRKIEFIGLVLMGFAFTMVGVSLVIYSFNELFMEGTLAIVVRVIGFAGTIVVPSVWYKELSEIIEEQEEYEEI